MALLNRNQCDVAHRLFPEKKADESKSNHDYERVINCDHNEKDNDG